MNIEDVLADKRRIHESVRALGPQYNSLLPALRLDRSLSCSVPREPYAQIRFLLSPQMPMPESIQAVEQVIREYHGRIPLAVASSGVRPNVTRVRGRSQKRMLGAAFLGLEAEVCTTYARVTACTSTFRSNTSGRSCRR